MTTSWTIRSRRNVGAAASVIRPVSLNSLPDLSDDLEMGGRSSNGSSALLLPSVGYTIGGLNQSDSSDDALIYRCQSNASVSFLGRQITRQYRSSFVLSDQQMIGVTRCETFKPDESKADVQVSLSLQGPPDESVVPGHQRSRSAPSRVCDCLDDNRGWARLMLTTDRPRDAELLSRFGSRNYYTKCEPNSSYFHRRIIPYYNEEEFMLQPSTPTVVNSSFDTNREGRNEVNERDNFGIHDSLASSTLALTPNPDPFIDRVEKDTCPLPSRHQANHSSPSPLGYLPQSDKDPSSQTPDFLPSTERSESIIYLNRSKSEASLSAAKPAPRDPWRVPPCPDSIDDRSANADSTLSLQTDLENDDAIEDAPAAVPPRVPQPRTQNTEGSLSPSSLSFVSSTNGVLVRLSGPGGQQCVSSFFKEKPKKTATLHTFLPGIDREKDEVGHLGSQFSPVIQEEPELDSTLVESEEGRVVTTQTGESVNVNPIPPLPRERKKLVCSENNILSATQTDGGRGGVDAARPNSSSDQNHPSVGLKGTRNDPNQNVSEERDAGMWYFVIIFKSSLRGNTCCSCRSGTIKLVV
uniref:HECT-type E3 ubiquitin transferase n=1 Tax=Mesocestoides corti TaxID=53468 RepID=A0A5K3FVT5_MESCO